MLKAALLAQVTFSIIYGLPDDGPHPKPMWDCPIATVQMCTVSGCTPQSASMHMIVAPENSIYARCVGDHCDSYSATFGSAASSMVITTSKGTALARVFNDLTIIDVSTSNAVTTTMFGKCKNTVAPVLIPLKK